MHEVGNKEKENAMFNEYSFIGDDKEDNETHKNIQNNLIGLKPVSYVT
jgi:hypothetical protein